MDHVGPSDRVEEDPHAAGMCVSLAGMTAVACSFIFFKAKGFSKSSRATEASESDALL